MTAAQNNQPDGSDTKTKNSLFVSVTLLGSFFCGILAAVSFWEGNQILALSDSLLGIILIANLIYYYKTGNYRMSCFVGITIVGIFFMYLMATGGEENTGFMWYFTFPLFTSFLLGKKRGIFYSLVLLIFSGVVFLADAELPFLAQYSLEFKMRFIPAFLLVLLFSYVYEARREKDQDGLFRKNVELEAAVLRRTAELAEANARLSEEVRTGKLAGEDLSRKNTYITSIIESLTHPFYVINAENYEIQLGNSASGYHGNSEKIRCHALSHRADAPCASKEHPCPLEKIKETQKPVTVEHIHYGADGDARHVEVHAYPLLDSTGKVVQMIEYNIDITDRKKAEDKLLESEKRYRSLVENIPDTVIFRYELGVEKPVEHVSESILELTGYPAEDFIQGKIRYSQLIHPDDSSRVRRLIDQAIKKEQSYDLTYRIVTKEQITRWVQERGKGIDKDSGTPRWLDGVLFDITKEKRLEEESLKLRNLDSLGILAGGIAHDFNNLLMGIFGNLDLAIHGLDQSSKEYSFVRNSLDVLGKAKGLTGQLLTFAKGGGPLKEVTLLKDIISGSVAFTLSGSAISHTVDCPENLWSVGVDRNQLGQVFHNLMLNAKEAMPEGGKIFIRAENSEIHDHDTVADGRYVKLTISDEGCGISADIMPKIFDPYFSTKSRGAEKGTGLGLAICYSIITKHRGHIALQSEPGKGTTVTLLMPATDEPDEQDVLLAADERGRQAAADSADLSGKTHILLMEDEEQVSEVVTLMLETLDCSCVVAPNGEEAVIRYNEAMHSPHPFDGVILDLTIRGGGMGGKETIKKLHAIDPQVKALVASGYADDPVLADCRAYGFIDAAAKPFTIENLRDFLQQL